jgi:hypothetical protein
MLRRVALVRTDVSEQRSASIIRMTRIGELGTTLAATNNRRTLRRSTNATVAPRSLILVTLIKEALSSSETSVLTRTTRRNVPEDDILHNHSRENLKSYIKITVWTLYRRRDVSPVRNERGFYIPEDDILHSHRLENFKSYTVSLDDLNLFIIPN